MDQLNMALQPLQALLAQAGALLPKLLLALAVALGGWLLAKTARLAVVKGLRALNFHVLAERAGIDGLLRQGGAALDTAGIVGLLVHWLVVLAALILAFNGLGLAPVAELLGRAALFVPRLILAVAILVGGAYFARCVDNAIRAYGSGAGLADTALLGRLARYAALVFVVLIALDQLEIGAIIRQSFLILLAGAVFALALAFGLGGRHWAAALLERWWPRK